MAPFLPNDSFQRDLLWFKQILILFNGIVTFRRSPVQYHVFVDAMLVGMGALWGKRVYTAGIRLELRGRYSITQYEMYNIAVAVWTWGHLWQDKVVLIVVTIRVWSGFLTQAKLRTNF